MKRLVCTTLTFALVAALVGGPGASAQESEDLNEGAVTAALAGPSDWQPRPGPASFQRVATLLVGDAGETSAPEIVASFDGGNQLVFSDAESGSIGFADITDPTAPTLGTPVGITGEPTAVSVLGDHVLVGEVDAASTFDVPDGNLLVIDLDTKAVVRTVDLGGQPDSIAVSPDGAFAAVVIENERDEDETVGGQEGALPQLPAGELIVVDTSDPDPLNWTTSTVSLTGLTGANEPTDPEPEFVDINSANKAVVSLQENNAIAIVDLATASVDTSFSAGQVPLANVDVSEDDIIDFDGSILRERQPDAVAWIGTSMFATANEGDIPHLAGTIGGPDGGSRGFTIFDTAGNVVFESGESFEYALTAIGHFPLGRAENKGIEPEAVEYAEFDGTPYLFVGSERGSVVGVYDVTNPYAPQLRQLLPSGIGPEGLLAIPDRDLIVVANEVDEDFPSSLMIFAMQDGAPSYPTLTSGPDGDNRWPIPWGAQSGLAADPSNPYRAYSVQDSFYADSRIFEIDLSTSPPTIVDSTPLTAGGSQVSVDLEGVAVNPDGGWWVATEGAVPASGASVANAIHRVAPDGSVLESINLPADRQACWTSSADDLGNADRRNLRFGFEGVTVAPDGTVWVAQQREWTAYVGAGCTQFNDAAGTTALWRYLPSTGEWEQYPYTLDAPSSAGGWVGLSEIVAYGPDTFLVIERDNQIGPNAEVKRLYAVTVPSAPGAVSKGDLLDLLPALQSHKGIVLDKVEGAMVTSKGYLYISTDNDGVDDSPGESLFLNLGHAADLIDAGNNGYWIGTESGGLAAYGAADGSTTQVPLSAGATLVDLVAAPNGSGAWALDSAGVVTALGAAPDPGNVNTASLAPGETLVALVPRPQADGAWAITDRGRAIALGAAPVVGGVESLDLNAPIVDAAATPSGMGLYMAAGDGGIFTSGDASFEGSMGGAPLNAAIVAMAADPDGEGYWLFASDGGVFAFDAAFQGSLGAISLNSPVVSGIAYGSGYMLAGEDGGVFIYSTRPYLGSSGANPTASPVVAIAAFAQ